MYRDHLSISPSWFFNFVDNAVLYFGDDVEITFDDGYGDVWYGAMYAIGKGIKTTIFVPTAHLGHYLPGVPLRVMGVQELSFLLKCGINIGSHGHNHIRWTQGSKEDVYREIVCSIGILRSIRFNKLGLPMSHIAIAPPHGDFYESHVEIAKSLQISAFYGTTKSYGVAGVTTRCLADMTGYIENEEEGLQMWPWQ
jgi:peptidoglycan/xylan/chitin deacetylase (PgdA/CDA1 family)